MQKNPPPVKKQLRQEVGFACPVPDCDNPYLYFHHFDPPWRTEQHNRTEDMIALCAEHHAKADSGAFTVEQLRGFKNRTALRGRFVKGRFDWLRRDLLVVLGSNVMHNVKYPVVYHGKPLIWFNRDHDDYMLLNLTMRPLGFDKRVQLRNSEWLISEEPADIISPPGGRYLKVTYHDEDNVELRFSEVESPTAFERRFGPPPWRGQGVSVNDAIWEQDSWVESGIRFPVTVVEITLQLKQSGLLFSKSETVIEPVLRMGQSWMLGAKIGIEVGAG